jgi:allantoicase
MMKRATCWALTGSICLTWEVARWATMLDNAGLWLDGWANRTAARYGVDMIDVLAPLNERLPDEGEA